MNNNINAYLKLVRWAERRYTVNGLLPTKHGDNLLPFARIEARAWNKYMAS